MLFFYVRHGDPIYKPNMLTPLGARQAEAVAKRLALYGIDEIYASPSERAKLTAQPTCELVKKEMKLVDFADEAYAWRDMTVKKEEGGATWLFQHAPSRHLMTDAEVLSLGHEWYTHPAFAEYNYKAGIDRVTEASNAFFAELGYERIPGTAKYKVTQENEKRVAFFAHQGFGLLFLSCLLNIPYSVFCMHFDMTHTGVTAINFKNENGICIPTIMTLSNDAHLYREGLPTKYCNEIYF